MKRAIVIFFVLLFPLISYTTFSQTDVYLKIGISGFAKTGITVADFQYDRAIPDGPKISDAILQVLSNDLKLSGYFNLLDRTIFLDKARGKDYISQAEDKAQTWASMGLQTLVIGNFKRDGEAILIEVELFDVFMRRVASSNTYKTGLQSLRPTLHKISDDIVFTLTGERGIAQTRIAFISQSSGSKELYVMDYDGYSRQRLTFDKSIVLSPDWSPDGTNIAFTSYRRGNPDIFLINVSNRSFSVLSSYSGLNTAPAWSPDGKKIALTLTKDGNAEIYTVNRDGSNLQRLTYSPTIDTSPTWAPNGAQIAFTSDRAGSPQIYIMDVDGSDVRRLTYQGSYNDSPAWSPRGDKITYVNRNGLFQICTIDINGANNSRLTSAGDNMDPSWSPNGLHIAFTSTRDGKDKPEIYMMDYDGSNQQRVTFDGQNSAPSWSPLVAR